MLEGIALSDWRSTIERQDELSADELVEYLTPDLLHFLGDLHGAPVSIAQAAVRLLPFGSRTALLTTGLVTAEGGGNDVSGEAGLRLTRKAFEVMALAAMPQEQEEIDRLAATAAEIVANCHK
jgi:hypothetical protein